MDLKIKNGTMMQYFEWYLPRQSKLWNMVSEEAKHLSEIGITAVWLPPSYKGMDGNNDVGYTVYDLYDLGEFEQKGSVETKYGTKDEYINAIKSLKENKIQTYADISLDHKIGADDMEEVEAIEHDSGNRNIEVGGKKKIFAWTKFEFPGRKDTYSSFKWNWTHFDGVDWDAKAKKSGVYRFAGKSWDQDVDDENGNYDLLMGADLELSNSEVVEELKNWGRWYLDTTGVDGFRLDAVKHTSYNFLVDWLTTLRKESGKELFSVGEYWNADINKLTAYLENTKEDMSLFDVPLHFHFCDASYSNGNYDMRNLLKGTLVERNPIRAVTFVDNHDTQVGQALESWVAPWFKPLAYSVILLREQGYPCVFYGDYYGIKSQNIDSMKEVLDKLLYLRMHYAYGKQNDYFNHCDIVGWTREGIEENENSGLATIMSNRYSGSKRMYVGTRYAGQYFYDYLGNRKEKVKIENDGTGNFTVEGGSVSVWIVE